MDKKELDKLARLARIEVSEDEKDGLIKDLTNILSYVGELQEVVADMPQTPKPGDLKNVMRDDNEADMKDTFSEDILHEMPNKDGRYLKVKKIL
jgi:aspartyl-tRNA(Asn)/glutamyl-tRNA(Gln) amidotransferase subunit C